ncbi:MerR family transcriptional regulator [Arenivirga flava]|uniref:Transcriptional regulator n=1 Tax=Arenivirga flava TaxID=1930060 RepID=A0AA37UHV4_9MICO|nr:MerR family transcriptional regulator [Arenivirga flava]GMA27462.1 transcriptional regulator [Arenivirga flava]
MHPSLIPPRLVRIGDAAAFVGTTPRAIRHYHAIGLMPEPERGADGRRRYGYEELIRLLWVRRMADAGVALESIRDAAAADDLAATLERLGRSLAAQEAELRRQRSAVERMRARGARLGLLSDLVAERLEGLPEGSIREADLDGLLVMERIFGPVGAAANASRTVAMATDPALREESDRVETAEGALDDTVPVDDPRVAQAAAQRHAFETRLLDVIERSGIAAQEQALIDAWEAEHPDDAGEPSERVMSAVEAVGKTPYDLSPARVRCMELVEELAAR